MRVSEWVRERERDRDRDREYTVLVSYLPFHLVSSPPPFFFFSFFFPNYYYCLFIRYFVHFIFQLDFFLLGGKVDRAACFMEINYQWLSLNFSKTALSECVFVCMYVFVCVQPSCNPLWLGSRHQLTNNLFVCLCVCVCVFVCVCVCVCVGVCVIAVVLA